MATWRVYQQALAGVGYLAHGRRARFGDRGIWRVRL